MSSKLVVAVHGGAWAIPQNLWDKSIDGVKEAALIGYKALQENGSALQAVENAIVCLENNPVFDAGKGSVLTFDEEVEMDALIMEGETMNAGAVAAIKNVANPIKVARLVLEKTPHVLLVGEGANKFAATQGIKTVPVDDLVTQEVKEELTKYKKFNTTIDSLFSNNQSSTSGHETVGCVALDGKGHVACGTSTGGITAKMPGRVGDSPLIGAGGMADDEIGAVSTTGHGEAIIKSCLAKSILENIQKGEPVSSSITASLDYMKRRINGYGGAVCISNKGEVAAEFSSERMAWAFVKDNQLHYGLHANQYVVQDITNSS